MAGYPSKIIRDSLGPTFENEVKPTNPKREADANSYNLLCWQVAGMNGPAPRGFCYCTIAAGVITVQKQWFAWDPNHALANMSWVYTSAGVYTWALPLSGIFPDMNGTPTTAGLVLALVIPQGTTGLIGIGAVNMDGVSGTANCFTIAGAADPVSFGVWLI